MFDQVTSPQDGKKIEINNNQLVVPSMHVMKEAHLYSPRLVHPAQAANFKLQVIEREGDEADQQP